MAAPARRVSSSNRTVGTAPPRSSAATRAPASTSASVQTAPSLPPAPVTTATRLSSEKRPFIPRPLARCDPERVEGSRTRELWVGFAQHVEREKVVFMKRLERDAADHLVQVVWGNASAGRFHHHVLRSEHVTARQVARNDEALAHFEDRRALALVQL